MSEFLFFQLLQVVNHHVDGVLAVYHQLSQQTLKPLFLALLVEVQVQVEADE